MSDSAPIKVNYIQIPMYQNMLILPQSVEKISPFNVIIRLLLSD
jgi:hypothetical protein